jgi:hypothetical protein
LATRSWPRSLAQKSAESRYIGDVSARSSGAPSWGYAKREREIDQEN